MRFKISLFSVLLLFLCTGKNFAQTQFWSDTFEDTGAPSGGTRTPSVQNFYPSTPPYNRYFARVVPTDLNLQYGAYSNFQGAKIWAGEDIDAALTGSNFGQNAHQSISWTSINIAGKSGLSFKGLFACNNGANTWENGNSGVGNPSDFMMVSYRIDGGAWTDLIRVFATNGGLMTLETTGDSVGDGTPFDSYVFTELSANISGAGNTLELLFRCHSNGAGTEELAIDNFRLFETAACTSPIIGSNPANRSICVNGNTTFTCGATGATDYKWEVNTGSGFNAITDGGVYSGATTSTLIITGATAVMNGYQYRCAAINGVATCFTNSSAATLNISNITSSTAKNDVLCYGNASGSAAVSPSGGIGSYTYSWSPSGGTNSIATGLAATTYTVTITDAILCQITKNITINQPASALNTAIGGGKTDVSCNGGGNGTATVAPSGGTPGYTYSWAPSGGTAATATGLSVGTYTVTVTDANNCQATRSYTITQPTALNTTAGTKTDVSCNGGGNGTATVSPTGGTPGYTYSWAPSGGTAATATGLSVGTYTVTVTDANACQNTKSFTITQPTALNTTAGTKTDVSCNGGGNGTATVSPTGGTPSYTYSWAPSGGTAATATGLSVGTYTVTVTDANNCQNTKSFTITQPTALNTTAGTKTDVSCNGGGNGTATVSPTGGTPSYTYSWAPSGGTAATATGLSVGTYTVTVTDANNCQNTKSFTITQPTALNTTAGTKTDVSCNGGGNGTATVSPTGGTPSYTYSWSPSGGTAATATGLAAGTYTVTVTDANACQGTKSFTVGQPSSALDLSIGGGKTDVSCNGGSNGTATVAPTGGTPGYTYSWAPSGGTAATATGLSAGTYTVTVTDANGCQGTRSFTIGQPATALNLSVGGGKTDVSCNGGGNGTATVAPTGGTSGYTYSWAPSGGTAATATGLSVGTYTVTVTDANSCQATRSYTIAQPTALNTTVGTKTDVSCNGGGNGTATVSPTGGTPGYTYSWAPSGGTAATATGLSVGTYTVTVTDANNCQNTKSFTITQPTALNTTAGTKTDVSCNGGGNGTATVAPTGGTPGYTYSWAPSGGTAATATGLSAGTYTVTVTDANNCQGTKSFTIAQPTALNTTAGTKTDVSCNGGGNGTATVVPTGGTPGYTYSWAPSGGTAATATGLSAGTYTVTVTDANACQGTKSFTIAQPTALNLSVGGGKTDVSCNGGSNGTATVAPTGGTLGYTYSWSPSGGTAATATGLAAGTYTVTVTDANTCQATRSYTIAQPTALDLSVGGGKTDISCNGGSNGTATVAPTGGTPGYTYSWSPSGGTAATATGLAAGTYTVTVTDANTCQATRSFTIAQPTALDLSVGGGKTDVSCNGGSNGTATVAPTGGTPGYTYSWSPSGGTAATATGLAAGTYTVTVTDANTCQATRSFTLTEPSALAIVPTQTPVTCNGGADGLATAAVTGGTGSYTFSWSPSGGTSATASGLAAGTYTLTVKDANLCEATQVYTITQPIVAASTINQTACDSYTLNGQTYTATGSYVQPFTNAHGCDSTVTLNLTIKHSTASSITATACNSYTLNGTTYTASGTYTQPYTNAIGCDSTVTLHLTINHPSSSTLSVTACDSYTLNGTAYSASGTYTQVIPNTFGCDSTITLHLTINHATSASVSATACDSYTLNGITYTSSGTYVQHLTNAIGCDSVLTLNLTINYSTSYTLNATACDSYTLNGQTYTQSGTYLQVLTNQVGCDWNFTLNLTITHSSSSSFTESACGSYTWNGQTYTQSGVYTQTFVNHAGCDSTVTLTLAIHHGSTTSLTETACGAYTFNGQTYTQSGTYTQSFTNIYGCDSVYTLHVTIENVNTNVVQDGPVLTAAATNATYQWINCADGNAITGETARTFTATANGQYAVIVNDGNCSDTSSCYTVSNVSIIETVISATMNVYPNPNDGVFTVDLGSNYSAADIAIYSMNGKLVYQARTFNNGQSTIDISDVASGVYFLHIQSGEETKIIKLIRK